MEVLTQVLLKSRSCRQGWTSVDLLGGQTSGTGANVIEDQLFFPSRHTMAAGVSATAAATATATALVI